MSISKLFIIKRNTIIMKVDKFLIERRAKIAVTDQFRFIHFVFCALGIRYLLVIC